MRAGSQEGQDHSSMGSRLQECSDSSDAMPLAEELTGHLSTLFVPVQAKGVTELPGPRGSREPGGDMCRGTAAAEQEAVAQGHPTSTDGARGSNNSPAAKVEDEEWRGIISTL